MQPGAGQSHAPNKVRVLVVDDSATARAVLSRRLAADPQIEVAGVARDGVEALERVVSLRPDVITLDVEMPRLDGIETLRRIMQTCPTPVVMVSSHTRQGADATIQALELGAVDFVLKPVYGAVAAPHEVGEELCARVKLAAMVRLRSKSRAAQPCGPLRRFRPRLFSLVVIGASTGGPGALRTVLGGLPADLAAPVIVVQHMPPHFTRSLAARLDELGPLPVREASDGDPLLPGKVLLAPGDRHLIIGANGAVRLSTDPPECGVRPSVNVTLASAARRWGSGTLAVVLTGMGSDGTRGAGEVKRAGGMVIAEAESTCVVYGMPRSVAEAGYADEVLPLPAIAPAIARLCASPERRTRHGRP